MTLTLRRLIDTGECTLGSLNIDGKGKCFTLEDVYRKDKVQGETRIPEGFYPVKLRNAGGMTKKYAEKFGSKHKGMLWLQNVPDFEWVYIHYGNYAKNTDGCILVGSSADINKSMIGNSVDTYLELYKTVVEALENGEEVFIHIEETEIRR